MFLKVLQLNPDLQLRKFSLDKNDISDLQMTQINLFMRTHAAELKRRGRSASRGASSVHSSEERGGSRSQSKGRRGSRSDSKGLRRGSRKASRSTSKAARKAS